MMRGPTPIVHTETGMIRSKRTVHNSSNIEKGLIAQTDGIGDMIPNERLA